MLVRKECVELAISGSLCVIREIWVSMVGEAVDEENTHLDVLGV